MLLASVPRVGYSIKTKVLEAQGFKCFGQDVSYCRYNTLSSINLQRRHLHIKCTLPSSAHNQLPSITPNENTTEKLSDIIKSQLNAPKAESQPSFLKRLSILFKGFGYICLFIVGMLSMNPRQALAAHRVSAEPRVVAVENYKVPSAEIADNEIAIERQSASSMPTLPQEGSSSTPLKGVPLEFDDIMKSRVYSRFDVPKRNSKQENAVLVDTIMDQYDMEDFDLGIKQFLIEEQVRAKMEQGGGDKGGSKKGFEETLGEAVFNEETQQKAEKKTEDVVEDAFTTEVVEEALAVMGEVSAVNTAWRVNSTMNEMTYTQMFTLASEGHIDKVRFFGPERRAAMVTTRASAPGGLRVTKVVLPPDPDLMQHLEECGVEVNPGVGEMERLGRAFAIQVIRYTFPFMLISALFWILHTWILDPVPNKFRRREFIRYRREIMYVASKLNFRTPVRQVNIDTSAPDFIPWEDINGIDDVKREISEIIEYLKDPSLLRLRGVARIGGVLLAGAPGTGKTLLAKAIAAESGVRMYTCSGTDFFDVFAGVGARRIRETFDKLRSSAPAILFVDEFDALGASRGGSSSGSDESASIINELLVQMDGFEDNKGIVVLGATNRPGAIDAALIRPGRFDRIVYMPLPDASGRAKILQVHARNKAVDTNINWYEVSRAMAGFTGADCMGLMERAARMAGRKGRELITEDDIYAALENKAMEDYHESADAPRAAVDTDVPAPIPSALRKSIAVYEAAKALIAYITPDYDDIARVSVCPMNLLTGHTMFVEDEDRSVDTIVTRGEMESNIVVYLAGRCAETLVMGESELTSMGLPDLQFANMIAREMILICGMGKRTGPQQLMKLIQKTQNKGLLLRSSDRDEDDEKDYRYMASDMSSETARIAMAEVMELLEAGEAKACYGLVRNWAALGALTQALLERGTLNGAEVGRILETAGVVPFPDPYTLGYGWDEKGELQFPNKPEGPTDGGAAAPTPRPGGPPSPPTLTGIAAKTWYAGTPLDVPRGPDGKFPGDWHWNVPYSFKRELPDWFAKEVERYSY